MKQYKELLEKILREGTRIDNDRTGVGTIRLVDDSTLTFDLKNGFPLVTGKRTPLKSILHELLWFLSGNTNIKYLLDNNVNIWNLNCYDSYIKKVDFPVSLDDFIHLLKTDFDFSSEHGDLGKIYGYQWRHCEIQPSIVPVKRKNLKAPQQITYPLFAHKSLEDEIYTSSSNLKFKIVKNSESTINTVKHIQIQFLHTGYTKIVPKRYVKNNAKIKDIYYPMYYGVGYIGTDVKKLTLTKLWSVWKSMLARCYDTSNEAYKYYGGKGVHVDKEWHSFYNFYNSIKNLPNYLSYVKNNSIYELDKDYFGSNVYSENTCVWSKKSHNSTYPKSKAFKITTPLGKTLYELSQRQAARNLGLRHQHINACLNGIQTHTKNFKFSFLPENSSILYRYSFDYIDQVKNLIVELEKNRYSRRHLICNWSSVNLHEQALPPCHLLSQFFVNPDGTLDCKVYQRSCDSFLGLPFNIASYSTLLHIFANICGLNVGRLIYTFGDLHVYQNHISAVEEYLSRSHFQLPKLKIKRKLEISDLDVNNFNLTVDDFELIDYQYHPAIKAEMAV